MERKLDLLLINPAERRPGKISEHLGIAGLSAYVSHKGFCVDILDLSIESINDVEAINQIMKKNPRMVGVSMLDATKIQGLSLIKQLRLAGYVGGIVVGGYFPTFCSKKLLTDFSEIDFVVRGEGEITLYELLSVYTDRKYTALQDILGLSYRQNGIVYENPARPLIGDLDELPPVDRKYTKKIIDSGEAIRVSFSRGCWGGCSFCDIIGLYGESFGKPWRKRSASGFVDELAGLVEQFNTTHFIFNDDQFLVKGAKAVQLMEEFAGELEKRNLKITFELMCRADTVKPAIMKRLKSVGLQRVFLGLESFDEKQLERYNKKISVRQNIKAVVVLYNLHIDVIASVILADAQTTLMDLLKQFMVLYQLRRKYFISRRCQISINKKLEVYPGSFVYREYKEKNILYRDDYLKGYKFRLKPLTAMRLLMLLAEENILRIITRPLEVFKEVYYYLAMKRFNTHKFFNLNQAVRG